MGVLRVYDRTVPCCVRTCWGRAVGVEGLASAPGGGGALFQICYRRLVGVSRTWPLALVLMQRWRGWAWWTQKGT